MSVDREAPDYHSSDEEFEPPVNEFAKAGAKSIAQVIDDASLRGTTKQFAKKLQQGGKWHERYASAMWMNRLNAFREHNLGKDPRLTPNSEDIIRFLAGYVQVHTKTGRGASGTAKYDTIKHAIIYLHKGLLFRHPNYKITSHEASRIQATVDTLLRDGFLTKEMGRSREPAGAVVARRLVTALLTDSIVKGTYSWSETLNDAACLLLISCLHCRSGDIIGDTKDTRPDLPGLRYSDLELVVGPGGGLKDVQMRIRMRSSKNHKDDAKKYFFLTRNALKNSEDNIVCPVKWTLILGLRSGNVLGGCLSVSEVLQRANDRHDKRVEWAYPDRPVLCSSGVSIDVDYDKLMPRVRANAILARALRILGTSVHITPHAMRFGAADDLQVVAPQSSGMSLDQIGAALGHLNTSRESGTTQLYAQSFSNIDHWSDRVTIRPEQQPFSRHIQATDPRALPTNAPTLESFKKRRTPKEVTEDCEALGLDPSVATNRHYASRKAPKRLRSEPIVPEKSPFSEPCSVDEGQSAIDPRLEAVQAGEIPREVDVLVPEPDCHPADTVEDENMLIMELDDLWKPIEETADESLDCIDDTEDTAFDTGVTAYDPSLLMSLKGDMIEFVDRFAAVNTIRVGNAKVSKRWLRAKEVGEDPLNSIGPVETFRFQCPKRCGYDTATSIAQLESHPARCLGTPEEPTPKTAKAFPCSAVGCTKAYTTKGQLKVHKRELHDPQQCYIQGCADTATYYGEKELFRIHISSAHPPKGAQHPTIADNTTALFTCPEAECDESYRFYASRSLNNVASDKHLKAKHGIELKEEREKRTPKFPGNPCFHPGCMSTKLYGLDNAGPSLYKQHLEEAHGIYGASEQFEYSWKRVRGNAMPPRPIVLENDTDDDDDD